MTEQELWDTANEYLRRYGRDAGIEAAQKADEFMERADLDGAHCWRTVVRTINILLERPYGAVH